MADERNFYHLKTAKGSEAAATLTAPRPKERGRRGPKGHMALGGETVSHHITSDLPKKDRKKLFRFERRLWYNQRRRFAS